MTSADLTDTALRLRLARLEAGLKQAELAERIGVHQNTVISAESARSDPRFSVVAAWAAVTDKSLDWIARG